MSYFNSGVVGVSGALDLALLLAALNNKLPVSYSHFESLGTISTTSTSAVDLDAGGLTVTGVTDDEFLLFMFQHSISCGTSGDRIASLSYRNGSPLNNYVYDCCNNVDTNAQSSTQYAFYLDSGQSGSVTYTHKWYRNSGSGTIYSAWRLYKVLRFKSRA